jgi:hypothetical protein
MDSLEAKIHIINFASFIRYFHIPGTDQPDRPGGNGRPTMPVFTNIKPFQGLLNILRAGVRARLFNPLDRLKARTTGQI